MENLSHDPHYFDYTREHYEQSLKTLGQAIDDKIDSVKVNLDRTEQSLLTITKAAERLPF